MIRFQQIFVKDNFDIVGASLGEIVQEFLITGFYVFMESFVFPIFGAACAFFMLMKVWEIIRG